MSRSGRPVRRVVGRLVDLAHVKGFGPDSKAGDILAWLTEEFDLGRGHGMALVHVIKNGPGIDDTHLGTTGSHRDAEATLRLDGIARRVAHT